MTGCFVVYYIQVQPSFYLAESLIISCLDFKRTAMFYNYLFPQRFRGRGVSLLLLVVRVVFGILFFVHGLDKLVNFNTLVQSYPSVFGFGSYMTLMVTVFCEFACSMFFIAGCVTRIALLPMIVAMAVAFFDVHDGMMPDGELSLIFMIVFIGVFLTGPGRYSVDFLIDRAVKKDKKNLQTH